METQTKSHIGIGLTAFQEVLQLVKECDAKESATHADLFNLISQIYSKLVMKWKDLYDNSEDTSLEELESFTDTVIDQADMMTVMALKSYSLDVTDAHYEIPGAKIAKMKKHYMRILRVNKESTQFTLLNELFSVMFIVAYAGAVKNAMDHRALVKQQQIKN